jgi:quercetin dioxygenase-like cupin family protein
MTDATPRHYAVLPRSAKSVWFLGQALELKITSVQTGGAYAVTEATAAPGFRAAPHRHHREDESVYVLDGELQFTIDGDHITGPAGTFVHIPREATHAWTNRGPTPARLLTIYTPGGFEGIFEDLGEPIIGQASGPSRPPDLDALRGRAPAYGLEILKPR